MASAPPGTSLVEGVFRLAREWSREEILKVRARLHALDTFHIVSVRDAAGETITTSGILPCRDWLATFDKHGIPDVAGRSVLDIGCSSGYYGFVAKTRGAARVLGIDVDPIRIAQARVLRDTLELDVPLAVGAEAAVGGSFDVVMCMGVLYHTQNPIAFLTRMARVCRDVMFLETELLLSEPLSRYAWFIEGAYCGDRTNWWIFGRECVEGMVRTAGFSRVKLQGITERPPPGLLTPEGDLRQGRAIFICEK